MRIAMQEICKFAYAQPNSKNCIGGENVINRGHVLNCGKANDDSSDSYQIIAFCLQTTNLKGTPHEIKGEILNDGQIVKIECTCKAGLGSACKHIVAVLLYCNRLILYIFISAYLLLYSISIIIIYI